MNLFNFLFMIVWSDQVRHLMSFLMVPLYYLQFVNEASLSKLTQGKQALPYCVNSTKFLYVFRSKHYVLIRTY